MSQIRLNTFRKQQEVFDFVQTSTPKVKHASSPCSSTDGFSPFASPSLAEPKQHGPPPLPPVPLFDDVTTTSFSSSSAGASSFPAAAASAVLSAFSCSSVHVTAAVRPTKEDGSSALPSMPSTDDFQFCDFIRDNDDDAEEEQSDRHSEASLLETPSWKKRKPNKVDRSQLHVFALELSSNGARKFIGNAADEFALKYLSFPPHMCHHYEIIRENMPCRLYFDIEFKRGLNPTCDGDAMMRIFTSRLKAFLLEMYNIPLTDEQIVDLDSTTDVKFSRHLVCHFANRFVFANNGHAGSFVSILLRKLAAERADNVDIDSLFVVTSADQPAVRDTTFVDSGVYTKNRCFRLWKSSKIGKQAVLERAATCVFPYTTQLDFFFDSLISFGHSTSPLKWLFCRDPLARHHVHQSSTFLSGEIASSSRSGFSSSCTPTSSYMTMPDAPGLAAEEKIKRLVAQASPYPGIYNFVLDVIAQQEHQEQQYLLQTPSTPFNPVPGHFQYHHGTDNDQPSNRSINNTAQNLQPITSKSHSSQQRASSTCSSASAPPSFFAPLHLQHRPPMHPDLASASSASASSLSTSFCSSSSPYLPGFARGVKGRRGEIKSWTMLGQGPRNPLFFPSPAVSSASVSSSDVASSYSFNNNDDSSTSVVGDVNIAGLKTITTKTTSMANTSALTLPPPERKQHRKICYVVVNNRYCHNVGRHHKSNGVYFVADLDACVVYQKCYDPECLNFRGPSIPIPPHLLESAEATVRWEEALATMPLEMPTETTAVITTTGEKHSLPASVSTVDAATASLKTTV